MFSQTHPDILVKASFLPTLTGLLLFGFKGSTSNLSRIVSSMYSWSFDKADERVLHMMRTAWLLSHQVTRLTRRASQRMSHLFDEVCSCTGEVKKVVGLVGKGVTFDSGGYNLKVGGMIDMMKFDMGGAAAVLGAAQTLAVLQPPGVQASAFIAAFSFACSLSMLLAPCAAAHMVWPLCSLPLCACVATCR